MVEPTLDGQIQLIVQDELSQQQKPILCTITKIYDDHIHVDVSTDTGTLNYLETIGHQLKIGNKGVIIFTENDSIVITN